MFGVSNRLTRGHSRPLLRDGLIVVALILAVFIGQYVLSDPNPLSDARAYWARDLDALYANSRAGTPGAYVYSPAFAQAITPLTILPWDVFATAWTAGLLGVVLVFAGPMAAVVLFLPPVALELRTGNIHLLLAAATVIGLRWPASWAFILLTKVTPGIGVLWFAFRGEWGRLWIALGATAAIAGLSFVLAPGLWVEWLVALASNIGGPTPGNAYPVSLWLRVPLAVLVVAVAARRDWPALVPVAVTLAMPVLWTDALATLVASLYLLRRGRSAGR